MFKLANLIMGGVRFLGATDSELYGEGFGWVDTLMSTINKVLIPILGIVGGAGIIWAVVLGVNMARADSQEKREEAKKRLISLVVGIVILVVLIVFFAVLFPEIIAALVKPKLVEQTP